MIKEIIMTGCGMIGDFGAGKLDFSNFILQKKEKKKISDFDFDNYIDTGVLRRADINSHFACAAAQFAIQDAQLNLKEIPSFLYKGEKDSISFLPISNEKIESLSNFLNSKNKFSIVISRLKSKS